MDNPTDIPPEQFLAEVRKDPVIFLENVLKCGHWEMQDQIVRAVFQHQRVTVKSCFGVGKTYISARLALTFLFSFEDSIVITTAPTFRQVENVLWRELRQAAKKSPTELGGNLLKTRYELSEKWYALGISSDKEENFQGFHAEWQLNIVDEAGGVAENSLGALEALMTSKGTKLLYIGNPIVATGGFYDSFKDPTFYHISISAFDTPNFTSNGIKTVDQLAKMTREEVDELPIVNAGLVTPSWVHDKITRWGVDSPMFQSKVMAIFPDEGDDTLIKLSHIERALNKEWDEEEWKFRPRSNAIGIDVARFGGDTTVLIAMDNGKMHEKHVSYKGKDTMQTVGQAINLFRELGFDKRLDTFVVDDTGVGGGVTDRLVELGYNVIPFNSAESAENSEQFRDIKAEAYWELRQAFIDGEIRIHDIGRLIKDISSIKYEYSSKSQILIKSKKDMKKEGLDSPDYADALMLAYYWSKHTDWGDVIVDSGKKTEKEEDYDEHKSSSSLAAHLMRRRF